MFTRLFKDKVVQVAIIPQHKTNEGKKAMPQLIFLTKKGQVHGYKLGIPNKEAWFTIKYPSPMNCK